MSDLGNKALVDIQEVTKVLRASRIDVQLCMQELEYSYYIGVYDEHQFVQAVARMKADIYDELIRNLRKFL